MIVIFSLHMKINGIFSNRRDGSRRDTKIKKKNVDIYSHLIIWMRDKGGGGPVVVHLSLVSSTLYVIVCVCCAL